MNLVWRRRLLWASIFSPGRIQRARDLQEEKEAQERANRERIAAKKVQAAVNKAQNEAAKAERALQAEARRKRAAEEKLRKAEKRTAKQAARQVLQDEKEAQLEARKAAKQTRNPRPAPTAAVRPKTLHTVVEIQGTPKRRVIVGSGPVTRTRAVIPLSRSKQSLYKFNMFFMF